VRFSSAVSRIALLVNQLAVVKAGSESEIESAVVSAAQQQASALTIGNDANLSTLSGQIASFALRYALPTVSESRDGVKAGLFLSYGPNQADSFRQAGILQYVGRILKGEKPADLPVLQPTKIELFVNLKTVKALGLNLPQSLLLRVDEAIE
jgi:putative tryptophan/tyrosine transport system substrate-binding protein